MKTKQLNHENGLRIELDKNEVFPEDPGQGTPALVYKKLKGRILQCNSTFWCCQDTGVLEPWCGTKDWYDLTPEELNWLRNQEDTVNDFLYKN